MTEWQPIETAPKNGTRIIVYRPEGYETSYVPSIGEDFWHKGLEKWANSNKYQRPTHWQPLPGPPPPSPKTKKPPAEADGD